MAAEKVTSLVVAIDTTDYSGNFERQMCAFITGQVGECGVGEELIEEARAELDEDTFNNTGEWIEEHIVSEADEHGCHRPASIWPSTGDAYESVAIFFDDLPPKEVIDVIIERAKRFAVERPDWREWKGEKKPLIITGVRVLAPTVDKFRFVGHTEIARYEV